MLMSLCSIAAYTLLLGMISCKPHIKDCVDEPIVKVDTTSSALDTSVVNAQYLSAIDDCEHNHIYFPTVVRLEKNDEKAFIYTDSSYFDSGDLDSSNREAYYDKVRALIPKDEIRVHQLVWRIKEMRKLQQGDGGVHTVMTWLTGHPSVDNPYYRIEVIYNMCWHLTPAGPEWLKVDINDGSIMVDDWAEGPISLKQWRKLNAKRERGE